MYETLDLYVQGITASRLAASPNLSRRCLSCSSSTLGLNLLQLLPKNALNHKRHFTNQAGRPALEQIASFNFFEQPACLQQLVFQASKHLRHAGVDQHVAVASLHQAGIDKIQAAALSVFVYSLLL